MDIPERKMLLEVLADGEKLLLDDGSIWFVNPGDIPTICTWIPTSSIEVALLEAGAFCPYRLTNLDEGGSVTARKES